MGQPTDGWHILPNVVAGSQADYQLFEAAYDGTGDWRVMSTYHRPHIGCQILVVVGVSLLFEGAAHALGL